MVGQLIDTALKNDPATTVVIVSDHGFVKVDHAINLAIPFIQAGLMETGRAPNGGEVVVTSWKAAPWSAGGLAAVMLHDSAGAQTREQVRALLNRLAADPANGIARILDAEEIKRDGGFPDAAFVVAMKPGYIDLLTMLLAIIAIGCTSAVPKVIRSYSLPRVHADRSRTTELS